MNARRESRRIVVGNVPVGGGAPIPVQSMLNVRTSDVDAALGQIRALADAGAEILRLAVDSEADAAALRSIFSRCSISVRRGKSGPYFSRSAVR